MSDGIKLLIVLILIAVFMRIGMSIGYNNGYSDAVSQLQNQSGFADNIFKTVAHINLSKIKNLKLIYLDTDSDIAYYMYAGDRDSLTIGETVSFYDGTESHVVSIDVQGFTVGYTDSVTFGYSGTAVLNSDGVQIGYVSERLANGDIRCIWI